MTSYELNMRVPHVCPVDCPVSPTDHLPKPAFEPIPARYRLNPAQEFWDAHSKWSQATFGIDSERGPLGALKHLEKEAREAQAEVSGPTATGKLHEEIADCLFLTFDAARRAGMTLNELLDTAFTKLDKNKKRIWAKPTNSDEPIEHVRGIHD